MPLTGYRILQQGSGVALDYCGKIFADFGADVVKLEPLGGDPLRTMPPVLANGESGLFAWLNTNKKSVTETPANLDALLPGADINADAALAIPTDEHWLPLLYVLGAASAGETPEFFTDSIDAGSISMLGAGFGVPARPG